MEEGGSRVVVRILGRGGRPLLVNLRVLGAFGLGFRMGEFWLGIQGRVLELGFPVDQPCLLLRSSKAYVTDICGRQDPSNAIH